MLSKTIARENFFKDLVRGKIVESVVLKHIQRLDPVGIGSRNLAECLKIQLDFLPKGTEYLKEAKNPPYYSTPKDKSVYECIIENKDICNTWEQKELYFSNSYVKSYADKIDFKKYFWFFEENSLHLFGGLIEWSIRNFDYNLEGDLPKVLWREMNGMNLDEQKEYLERSWYGHTSSILAKKFVNEIVLNWDIFK